MPLYTSMIKLIGVVLAGVYIVHVVPMPWCIIAVAAVACLFLP